MFRLAHISDTARPVARRRALARAALQQAHHRVGEHEAAAGTRVSAALSRGGPRRRVARRSSRHHRRRDEPGARGRISRGRCRLFDAPCRRRGDQHRSRQPRPLPSVDQPGTPVRAPLRPVRAERPSGARRRGGGGRLPVRQTAGTGGDHRALERRSAPSVHRRRLPRSRTAPGPESRSSTTRKSRDESRSSWSTTHRSTRAIAFCSCATD